MPACSWQLQAPTYAHKLTLTSVPQMLPPVQQERSLGRFRDSLAKLCTDQCITKGAIDSYSTRPAPRHCAAGGAPTCFVSLDRGGGNVGLLGSPPLLYDFKETSHINLQDVREVSEELKARVERCVTPSRGINFADSLVTIGAWGHGRSSSYLLNGLLRKSIPWFVLGQKILDNLHSGTKDKPADDPSRKAELREPVPPAPWLASLLRPQAMPRHAARHRPLPYSFARDIGRCRTVLRRDAALTTAPKGAGLRVGPPFESYANGCYDMKSDLTRMDVVEACT